MTNPARNPDAGKSATRDIVVDDVLPHAPEKVWRALTTAEIIGKWLMPNDFEPVVGKRFTFTTRPIGAWDGVVQCECWRSCRSAAWSTPGTAAPRNSRLDSVVTWTLQPEARARGCAWSMPASARRRTTLPTAP